MGYALPYIVFVLAGALALFGTTAIWVPEKRFRAMGFYLFWAAGLQFLLAMPAALIQGAVLMGPRTPPQAVASSLNPAAARETPPPSEASRGKIASQPPPLRMALAVAGAPIHMGGTTTRLAFELIDGPLRRPDRGYPSSAIAGGLTVTALAALQVLALGWLFGNWVRTSGNLQDRRLLILAGVVLVNSLSNVAWPWWGS
jgi:hypothetical protein